MKKLAGSIVVLFLALTNHAQIGMGQWRLHTPANRALDVVECNSMIYAAYETGVSEYDPASGEISMWDVINGLSDITISALGTDGSSVMIGYENGNLDLLKDNEVINIPAITLAQIQGSKRINKIVMHNGFIYLATGFGVVKIDPIKEEVRETYYPTNGNSPILDVAFRNDSIFALASDRVFTGSLNNPALVDPAQWVVDSRVPVLSTNAYAAIENVNNLLYISLIVDGFGGDTLYKLTATGMEVPFLESFPMEIVDVRNVDGRLLVSYFDGFIHYESNYDQYATLYTYGFSFPRPSTATALNGSYYVSDEINGLVKVNGGSSERIQIIGPPANSFYSMDWENGKLAVAGGGLSGVFKTWNASGSYVFEDESWTALNNANVIGWISSPISDMLAVSYTEGKADKLAIGSYSEIPVSILSGNVADTFTPYNSELDFSDGSTTYSYVSDLSYDAQGNLWVLNGSCTNPLKVYTNDGQWYAFGVGPAGVNQYSRKLKIDYEGNKWFTFRNQGLFGYNDNGTPSNPSDDKYIQLTVGAYSGDLPSSEVTALAVDFDNELWIGTDNGFAVLYNSEGAFDAGPGDYNAQRIKVEFEGNVEYVLGGIHITDIEVDGGNRKWMATENSGLILLSPDGLEVIHQFTYENSPLISNAIIDVEIDHNTGEVFIITDKGLVSYRSDGSYEDPTYSNVNVFPNPARPDFDGPITIQGIRYDSDVKITDISGNLVYQTTSNGGTATWNGRRLTGEKVATGVYLIWTAPNEGKGRYVGKVLVVN